MPIEKNDQVLDADADEAQDELDDVVEGDMDDADDAAMEREVEENLSEGEEGGVGVSDALVAESDLAANFEQKIESIGTLVAQLKKKQLLMYYRVGKEACEIMGLSRGKDGALLDKPTVAAAKYGRQTVKTIATALGWSHHYLYSMIKFFTIVPPALFAEIVDAYDTGSVDKRPVVGWTSVHGILTSKLADDAKVKIIQQAIRQRLTAVDVEKMVDKHKPAPRLTAGKESGRAVDAGKAFTKFGDYVRGYEEKSNLIDAGIDAFKGLDPEVDKDRFRAAKQALKETRAAVRAALKQLKVKADAIDKLLGLGGK